MTHIISDVTTVATKKADVVATVTAKQHKKRTVWVRHRLLDR